MIEPSDPITTALRADVPEMPPDVLARLSAAIADEASQRKVANGRDTKPDHLNPPTRYDKVGLGMRAVRSVDQK